MTTLKFTALVILWICFAESPAHLYNPYYQQYYRYSNPYAWPYEYDRISYSPYSDILQDPALTSYLATPEILPTLNVLAEIPYAITNRFTVVPMFVMSKNNMHMVNNAHIMNVSKKKPVMTIKTAQDDLIQCTPAVKIILERPITVYNLKSSVLFPSRIEIVHEGWRIPIEVGAVIAPVSRDTFVSVETPIAVRVVYAVPTRPITIDYVNNNDVIDSPETEAVVVETEGIPQQNVTILEFPDKEAEPVVLEEDEEQPGNVQHPVLLAPAGIVQSTQPVSHVEPFHNSKESPVLIAIREESKKKRV